VIVLEQLSVVVLFTVEAVGCVKLAVIPAAAIALNQQQQQQQQQNVSHVCCRACIYC
jgi:hypothetical protein